MGETGGELVPSGKENTGLSSAHCAHPWEVCADPSVLQKPLRPPPSN